MRKGIFVVLSVLALNAGDAQAAILGKVVRYHPLNQTFSIEKYADSLDHRRIIQRIRYSFTRDTLGITVIESIPESLDVNRDSLHQITTHLQQSAPSFPVHIAPHAIPPAPPFLDDRGPHAKWYYSPIDLIWYPRDSIQTVSCIDTSRGRISTARIRSFNYVIRDVLYAFRADSVIRYETETFAQWEVERAFLKGWRVFVYFKGPVFSQPACVQQQLYAELKATLLRLPFIDHEQFYVNSIPWSPLN